MSEERSSSGAATIRRFWDSYTRGLTREDLQRLFTREAREAYRYFARSIDVSALRALPWHTRAFVRARMVFLAFTLRLSPARRFVFGAALVLALVGLVELFRGISVVSVPFFAGLGFVHLRAATPAWAPGTIPLLVGFLLMNLLVLLEVADRLSLKNDLEIAREIQDAMLPHSTYQAQGVEAFGLTRPANTVGGDFYDILPLEDGRLVFALGDVAGKGSPASLLMALLLAIFRTLVDERLEAAALAERLNRQVARHAPASRFITLFFGCLEPRTGRLAYVNAGQTPPVVRRASGTLERLPGGGLALGMFEHSSYESHETRLDPGDVLVLYSDGVTEAEDQGGQPFDESGLKRAIAAHAGLASEEIARGVVRTVEAHARDVRLADDLTVLVVRRVAQS